jgi:hypothetical protein
MAITQIEIKTIDAESSIRKIRDEISFKQTILLTDFDLLLILSLQQRLIPYSNRYIFSPKA